MGSINELTFISENFFDIFRDIKSIYFAMASLLSGLTGNVSTGVSLVVVTGSVDEEASDSPEASFYWNMLQ